jgi:serine/threonine protein kinase
MLCCSGFAILSVFKSYGYFFLSHKQIMRRFPSFFAQFICMFVCAQAPELLRNIPLKSAKADVYSLGCTMFDMYFDPKDRPDALTLQSDTKAFTVPAHSNPHLRELLQKMLEWDPDKRPSADEVVKHRFVAQAVQQVSRGG